MTQTRQEATPEGFDILIGMLYFLNKNLKRHSLPCSTPILQEALYKLSRKKLFQGFLSEYPFQDRGYYHYASELTGDFRNLERTGCLSSGNPTFKIYTIGEERVHKLFEHKKKSGMFDSDIVGKLEKMADSFSDILSELEKA